MFLVLIIPAIFADLIVPHDPIASDLSHRLEPPAWVGPKVVTKTVVDQRQDRRVELTLEDARNLKVGTAVGQTPSLSGDLAVGDTVEIIERPGGAWNRPLGTDKLGRDLLSRIIKGAQISLLVSVVVIAISGVIGTVLGIMASYFGGWVDYLISRIIDVAMALPVILIALVLVVVVGPGLKVLVIVITGVLWSRYARLVRGETLSIMSQDFINLARVAGSSHLYVMARHVFPNVFNSLIVLATLQVGYVIIIESALSFIGVGIPRPTPSWGSIVADGRDLIIQAAWWVSLFPGLAIVLTVLSVNLVGDWLRDRLDPRLRQI
ncbi:MAG: ABC transporter permease [Chloroflexi bacterium]|nr:ABC transporter permease [Chloroflexota bacterium]MYE41579.1 ABC transporter permease [Chloroflexota bacterium]